MQINVVVWSKPVCFYCAHDDKLLESFTDLQRFLPSATVPLTTGLPETKEPVRKEQMSTKSVIRQIKPSTLKHLHYLLYHQTTHGALNR